ncbi:hypothetical protein IFR04_011160 [Cadophora malorum]|uniref:NAD(P)/FAD-dependent oxidoreductase n=1 Tax=Cadophora malorum TaxID=108018 RepID=A0A8H7TBA2_9HELO|nr:hypothetical protein IFR04_011160 [Cadophora malorum]
MSQIINVDYLVIGAGAMGMAFVDTLLTENPNATFALVDRYNRPGGHWNKAYPFVRLHQPSKFYGVSSKDLGEDRLDEVGWNRGMYELATGDEVLAYYTKVLTQRFLPSGRVSYYPLCEYTDNGEFHSIVTGDAYSAGKDTRTVDATFMRVKVPSMGPPAYSVAEDVNLITPNALVSLSRPYANYTVVGAGKTGIDACLWMLSMGIKPRKITWIMPRDSWFLDRSKLQPKESTQHSALANFKRDAESIMEATSADDLLARLGAAGSLLRFSEHVWPTMYRCATVSLAELEQVRKIENVVRMGRVKQISASEVLLDGGKYTPVADTIYIDCTADGLKSYPPEPVFNGNHLTLQAVRSCQQVFSAAFIAHVETAYDNDEKRNQLCSPISHPNQAFDWLKIRLKDFENGALWQAEPKTAAWLRQCRLDLLRGILPPLPEDPEEKQKILETKEAVTQACMAKVKKLLDIHDAGVAAA